MALARKQVFALVGLIALASCQSAGPGGPAGPVPAPTGVEGQWMSSDGVAVSTFVGGVFTTTALDTGNKLAEGSYVASGATVQITGTSVIRQSPIAFNCLLVASRQLNCTSSSGQQFTLVRRA